jgi:hydrogenase-4 component F
MFAGLLHMTLHTLAKASIFQCVGRAAQLKRGQRFADISGLLATQRALGLTLAAGIVAVAALPPFGLFSSEFLIVTATMRNAPLLAIPLGIGLVVGGWALIARLQSLCLGAPTPDVGPAPSALALAPVWLHLALVLVLGLAMPTVVTDWLASAAR